MAKYKPQSNETRDDFYTEMKIVSANVEAAKSSADKHDYSEAHHCLDKAQGHLVQATLRTEVQIAKRDEQNEA